MEEKILSCDFDKYENNIFTPNWITECWRVLKQCNTTKETTVTWKPLRRRKLDVTLMEAYIHSKRNEGHQQVHKVPTSLLSIGYS
jgi:hypothetical protein